MRAVLAALALVVASLAPAQAQIPTTINVKVYFTPQAKTAIGAADIGQWVNDLFQGMYTVLLQSQATTRFNTTIEYSTTVPCCGGYRDFGPPGALGVNALLWAANDSRLMEDRDKSYGGAGADLVVVVDEHLSGPDGGSLMDCSVSSPVGRARKAVIGINVNSMPSVLFEFAKQFAAVNCANQGNASPYWWIKPGTSSTCIVFNTLGSVPQSRTANVWSASLSNPSSAGYSMASYTAAALDAASHCPDANGMGVTYVCSAMNCAPNGGFNATCSYNLRTTYSAPNPPSVANGTFSGTATLASQTCTNNTMLGLYSNPNKSFLGQPAGDATHNSVAAHDARTPTTTTFRTIKIAKILKAAVQAAQEK